MASLVMVISVGCGGEGEDSDLTQVTGKSLDSLHLTDDPPRSLTEACEKVATRTRLEVACPPIVPVGEFNIQVLAPDPEADGAFYDVQGESESLHRDDGDNKNPGHWSFGAATEMGALESGLRVDPKFARDCERVNKQDGAEPTLCQPKIRTFDLDGTPVEQYLMPEYPLGGINGGHLVFVWQGAVAAYQLSVHDPTNRERALAMLDGLLGETT